MKRRVWILLLSIVMVLSLVACGGGSQETVPTTAPTQATVPTTLPTQPPEPTPAEVYIQAAQGVILRNNDFGSDGTDENCAKAVLLNGAMNITLEGNVFSPLVSADMQIEGDHYKNITGSDVMFGDTPLYPDNE